MTSDAAGIKLQAAHENLIAAVKAQNEMAVIVYAEQAGFERMVPLAAAVNQAHRAEDWASTLLVKAIAAEYR